MLAEVVTTLAQESTDNPGHGVTVGHHTGQGYPAPGLESFHFRPFFTIDLGGFKIEYNWPLLLLTVAFVFVLGMFLIGLRRPTLVPRGVQNFLESVYDFVDQQISREVIGPEGAKWTPYLVVLFVWIFVLNIFEIIPGANFPVTSKFAFPCIYALFTWLIFMGLGMKRQGVVGYFRNIAIPPGVPAPLLVLLAPIELISTVIIRPFTLMVRLFANMFAGHVLLAIFFIGTLYWLVPHFGLAFAGVSFLMSTILVGFEILIDSLQAYIFTLLTAIYISGSLAPEH